MVKTSWAQADIASKAESKLGVGSVQPLNLDKPKSVAIGFDRRSAFVVGAGGLLTGIAFATFVMANPPPPTSYTLEPISRDEVWAASQSLATADAASLVAAATTCKRGLASIVVQPTGSKGGAFRVRSGSYTTTKIFVSSGSARFALPFPAPTTVGHGQISVESDTDGLDIYLRPGVHIEGGRTTRTIDVTWDARQPC